MRELRLANKIIKTLMRDRMRYSGQLWVDVFAMIGRCGILLLLYATVFKINNGIIGGLTFPIAAWSIFLYFSFSTLRLRDITRLIMQDVRSGHIEILFSKPISYLLYRIWWQIGTGIYSFVVIAVAGVVALWFAVGFPTTMTIGVFMPTIIAAFIFGSLLSLAIYMIIGLLAFWIEETTPILWLVDKTVMILGGSYLPFALFPSFMKQAALWSPFGASQFITHTVYASWQSEWLALIGIQLFWTIILGLTAYAMFLMAKRRVSVNGG